MSLIITAPSPFGAEEAALRPAVRDSFIPLFSNGGPSSAGPDELNFAEADPAALMVFAIRVEYADPSPR